jgi:flavin-dependent dehydrogenase
MDYEVIIVGSGPSGAATALHLAKIAPAIAKRTLILEKAHHPRPKLCAGGLLPDVDRALEWLDLDVTEVPQVIGMWANFVFEGRGLRMKGKYDDYAFRVIRRNEFDAWLANKAREAGVEIREGTRVRGVEVVDGQALVTTDQGAYRAKVVVGADGATGVVRRAVTKSPGHLARLIEVLIRPRPGDAHAPDEAYFEFRHVVNGIQGYVWDFPTQVEGEPLRCWGVYDSMVRADVKALSLPAALEAEVRRQGYGPDDYELAGYPLRWFDSQGDFAAPHILLVGDAAGIDASFGEGISPALGYAVIAAETIRDAFNSGDLSFAGYRDRILGHPLGKALRLRTLTAKVLYTQRSPAFQRLVWWRFPGLVRWYIETYLIHWTRKANAQGLHG